MRSLSRFASLLASLAIGSATVFAAAPDPWPNVDAILGRAGKVSGSIHRYTFPRSDLHVKVGEIAIAPALALTSWAAFDESRVMGDLVLRPGELDAVIRELQRGNVDVAAIHNHLLGESPQIVYMHFMGHGDPEKLATTLKSALAKTATPQSSSPTPAASSEADQRAFAVINEAMHRSGTANGRVLAFSIPRAETINDDEMEVPPAMGMATAINFQLHGEKAAATGDFVLVAHEVNPVVRELESHGIRVTAIHSHMLHESPRLFFLHFWADGAPRDVASALAAAVAKTNVRSP
jgi:hypothetical protein